jgi:hypothetical protein
MRAALLDLGLGTTGPSAASAGGPLKPDRSPRG